MSNNINLLKIQGKIQHYQWGGFNYIKQLLDYPNNYNEPVAEYWLGAHRSAPALLQHGNTLSSIIEDKPALLGATVQKQFGRLPYLLKILDVKDMLSIQVHPSKNAAEIEFAQENKLGKALNAPDRNYKDDNHKPELMMALSDFWLLHGFSTAEKLMHTVASVPEFSFMLPVFEKQGYKGLYELLMTMEQEKVNAIVQPLLQRIVPLYQAGSLHKTSPHFWAARAAETFNEVDVIDRGIFSIYLFNIVNLKEGEAIFQDAGILHAYLEGQNVEIMANSDNVLRGGLTPKHVDVTELMKHVIFEPIVPNIIYGTSINSKEKKFITPAPDFELSKIKLRAGETYQLTTLTTDVFLVFEGRVDVTNAEVDLALKKGESFVAFAGIDIVFAAAENTTVYRASVPLG